MLGTEQWKQTGNGSETGSNIHLAFAVSMPVRKQISSLTAMLTGSDSQSTKRRARIADEPSQKGSASTEGPRTKLV